MKTAKHIRFIVAAYTSLQNEYLFQIMETDNVYDVTPIYRFTGKPYSKQSEALNTCDKLNARDAADS